MQVTPALMHQNHSSHIAQTESHELYYTSQSLHLYGTSEKHSSITTPILATANSVRWLKPQQLLLSHSQSKQSSFIVPRHCNLLAKNVIPATIMCSVVLQNGKKVLLFQHHWKNCTCLISPYSNLFSRLCKKGCVKMFQWFFNVIT